MTTNTVELPRFERDNLSRVRATYPTRHEVQAAELAKLREWRKADLPGQLARFLAYHLHGWRP